MCEWKFRAWEFFAWDIYREQIINNSFGHAFILKCFSWWLCVCFIVLTVHYASLILRLLKQATPAYHIQDFIINIFFVQARSVLHFILTIYKLF